LISDLFISAYNNEKYDHDNLQSNSVRWMWQRRLYLSYWWEVEEICGDLWNWTQSTVFNLLIRVLPLFTVQYLY